jgi:hypothetical protein
LIEKVVRKTIDNVKLRIIDNLEDLKKEENLESYDFILMDKNII